MKKISVIIPCYNVDKYLYKCFNSIINQSIGLDNIEIILINDASTDNTINILYEIEQKYSEQVLVINCKNNHRQGGARNIGLSYASGEYISFVDADDWIDEQLYEKTYLIAKANDCDIVQFYYQIVSDEKDDFDKNDSSDKKSGINGKYIIINSREERKNFLLSDEINCGCITKLYKRNLINESGVAFPDGVIYEEPLFTYPLKFFGKKYFIINEKLYFYRMNENGTVMKTMNNPKTIIQHMEVQMKLWEFMKKTTYFEKFYNEIELYFFKSFYIEPIYFNKIRGYQLQESLRKRILNIYEKECPYYMKNPYIPKYMEENSEYL